MLSYRHAFHAGNHADVLKHLVLLALLDHLATKNKPFWYIDTHAGAGMYRLRAGYAAQRGEFDSGIGRLWNAPEIRELLLEAGFRTATVYWEGEDEDGDGNGEFTAEERGVADLAWIAYIVAQK